MSNARVEQVRCPYCGSAAKLEDSAKVYSGRSYGQIWICSQYPHCDAYTGQAYGGKTPLLANAKLRRLRTKAHAIFDPLWKDGYMKRTTAYQWLASKMHLPVHLCHISLMDVEQCEFVIEVVNQRQEKDSG